MRCRLYEKCNGDVKISYPGVSTLHTRVYKGELNIADTIGIPNVRTGLRACTVPAEKENYIYEKELHRAVDTQVITSQPLPIKWLSHLGLISARSHAATAGVGYSAAIPCRSAAASKACGVQG